MTLIFYSRVNWLNYLIQYDYTETKFVNDINKYYLN